MTGTGTHRIFVALALLCSVACGSARAADAEKAYRVLTINSLQTCSDLNAAVAAADDEDDWGRLYTFSVYTMGYLTGINRLAFDTYDIVAGENVKTHMVWLQKYCVENPRHSFELALYRLVASLYPMRATAKPGDN